MPELGSSLVNSYVNELPEKCRTCPVIEACIRVANANERDAEDAVDLLRRMEERDPLQESPLCNVLRSVGRELLTLSTDDEVAAAARLKRLAQDGQTCPGPRRGAPIGASLLWRIQAYVAGDQICQHPNPFGDKE
ncbi:MAG TPA: hypothetical protein VLF91_03770 [Candidatus Saccharimonadales bacterium]|nr:hypothetical protein [Candidatus Saccharimonadales bacterium]